MQDYYLNIFWDSIYEYDKNSKVEEIGYTEIILFNITGAKARVILNKLRKYYTPKIK